RHRGRNIRIQSLVRSKQDSPMTTLHIDRLETWRMIGLGCDAHQRDRRQCAGNIPITLASADKSMGKHDRPHLARYDVPPVNGLRISLVIILDREQDLIASGPPLDIRDVF